MDRRNVVPLTFAVTDVPTRPGNGQFNWSLWGRMLTHRQLELNYLPVEHNLAFAVAIERRVKEELYP